MYFDTHAHYNDEEFDADRDAVISSLPDCGVGLVVIPGNDMPTSRLAVELADKYPFVYAAVGVHPHDAKTMTDRTVYELKELASHEKVVAVGEIGLDYHYDLSPRDVQQARLRDQLELAREIGLPVIIHEREAVSDCLNIISDFSDISGVFHCFSGSWETAQTILGWGWYLSFTGAITFKNARKAPEVVKNMPIDRLMIETDSPYMAPVPVRGTRNFSGNLKYISAQIASLLETTDEEIARITLENARRFFKI